MSYSFCMLVGVPAVARQIKHRRSIKMMDHQRRMITSTSRMTCSPERWGLLVWTADCVPVIINYRSFRQRTDYVKLIYSGSACLISQHSRCSAAIPDAAAADDGPGGGSPVVQFVRRWRIDRVTIRPRRRDDRDFYIHVTSITVKRRAASPNQLT